MIIALTDHCYQPLIVAHNWSVCVVGGKCRQAKRKDNHTIALWLPSPQLIFGNNRHACGGKVKGGGVRLATIGMGVPNEE